MHHAAGAGYLSGNRQGCLRGTRKDVLWQIDHWLSDKQDQRIFWLNGLAGTGKSTIAQTFAETSFADGKLGASFFCSRDFEDRSNIQNIFPTLAFQLAYRYHQFREELLPVLRANPEIGQASLCSQLEKVIIGPLRAISISTLIIIDALDECKDEQPASAILSVLSRYIDKIPKVKFFITGRPETQIRTGFRLELLRPITEVLKLHDVEQSSVDSDIKLFLENHLSNIAKTRSNCDFTEDWPSSYDIDILCKKAAGLFIYASTVVKFVASPHHLPTERLTLIISLPQSTAHEGKLGVDALYTQVLQHAFLGVGLDEHEIYSHFKLVVGAVLLLFYPLSRKALSELLENCGTPSHISNAIRSLHSLLLIPENEVDPIRVFHKSFPDFLTDPERCRDQRFFVDPSLHHIDILFSCLNFMREKLRMNICNLWYNETLSEVEDLPTRREIYIGSTLEYVCKFWTKHLAKVPSNGPHVKQVQEAINDFFTICLLPWIEVLSLTENLTLGVYALHDVDQWYLLVSYTCICQLLFFMCLQTGMPCKWTNDSQRFLLTNFDDIKHTPAKIYYYFQLLSPSSSWLHEWYTAELLNGAHVVKGCPDKWGTCSRITTLEHSITALTSKKDIVTVGLDSGNIIILDAVTGSSRSVLSGHTGSVVSLAFSLGGTLLVSGDSNSIIKLWDIQTGGAIKTFHNRAYKVCTVAISSDTLTIASGTDNNGICLWNVRTGKLHRIINTQERGRNTIACIQFPPTASKQLISVSSSGNVQHWDTNGRKIGLPTAGYHIAFSFDGKHFVLCGRGLPTVRNSSSGAVAVTLPSPHRDFSCCCFSPSGEFIAGVTNATVYVWNITSTYSSAFLTGTFTPYNSKIFSLSYSSSLISAYSDNTIRFWQTSDNPPNQIVVHQESAELTNQTEIIYITIQKKDLIAISLDVTGVIKVWDLLTGLCEAFVKVPVPGKQVMKVEFVKRILLITLHEHQTLNDQEKIVWDIERECFLQIQKESVFCSQLFGYEEKVFEFSDGTEIRTLAPRLRLRFISWPAYSELPGSFVQPGVTASELPGSFVRPDVTAEDGGYFAAGYRTGELIILKSP